jgi:hypothetical protein
MVSICVELSSSVVSLQPKCLPHRFGSQPSAAKIFISTSLFKLYFSLCGNSIILNPNGSIFL